MSHQISKRKLLYLQCRGVCPVCGRHLQITNPKNEETYMTIDHMVPKSKGGTNNIENIRPLCRACNNARGNRDIENLISYKDRKELIHAFILKEK